MTEQPYAPLSLTRKNTIARADAGLHKPGLTNRLFLKTLIEVSMPSLWLVALIEALRVVQLILKLLK